MPKDTLYQQINDLMARWNPIGVPALIAFDEYRYYITALIDAPIDKGDLILLLTDMLKRMGLNDPVDSLQKKELDDICVQLLKIKQDI